MLITRFMIINNLVHRIADYKKNIAFDKYEVYMRKNCNKYSQTVFNNSDKVFFC